MIFITRYIIPGCISTAERKKMLSWPRPTEDAISAEAHRTCYLGRGSQKILSRPRLTERAISVEAHRTCYLGRGSQMMLSRPSLILDAFLFSSNFVAVALRSP